MALRLNLKEEFIEGSVHSSIDHIVNRFPRR